MTIVKPIITIWLKLDAVDKIDLAVNWAFKQFFGKSFIEAGLLFQDNAMHYQLDHQYMPSMPLILKFTDLFPSSSVHPFIDGH